MDWVTVAFIFGVVWALVVVNTIKVQPTDRLTGKISDTSWKYWEKRYEKND